MPRASRQSGAAESECGAARHVQRAVTYRGNRLDAELEALGVELEAERARQQRRSASFKVAVVVICLGSLAMGIGYALLRALDSVISPVFRHLGGG